jgi:hypothetical protein
MRGYAKTVAVVYLVLALMGVFPFLNTTFGLVPIYGHDIWLHALLGGVAAYFGFVYNEERQTATARAEAPARSGRARHGASDRRDEPQARQRDQREHHHAAEALLVDARIPAAPERHADEHR